MFGTETHYIQLNNLSEINDDNTGNSTRLYVHKHLRIKKELECQILCHECSIRILLLNVSTFYRSLLLQRCMTYITEHIAHMQQQSII